MPRIYRIVKSPCWMPEMNILLKVNSTSIKNFLIKTILKNIVSSKLRSLIISDIRKEYKRTGVWGVFRGRKRRSQKKNLVSERSKMIQTNKNLPILAEWLVYIKVTAYVALCNWLVKRGKACNHPGKEWERGEAFPACPAASPLHKESGQTKFHLCSWYSFSPGEIRDLDSHIPSMANILSGRRERFSRAVPIPHRALVLERLKMEPFGTKARCLPTQGALGDHSGHSSKVHTPSSSGAAQERSLSGSEPRGPPKKSMALVWSISAKRHYVPLFTILALGKEDEFKRLPLVLHQLSRKQHEILPATKYLHSRDPSRDLKSESWVGLQSLWTLCELNLGRDSWVLYDPPPIGRRA